MQHILLLEHGTKIANPSSSLHLNPVQVLNTQPALTANQVSYHTIPDHNPTGPDHTRNPFSSIHSFIHPPYVICAVIVGIEQAALPPSIHETHRSPAELCGIVPVLLLHHAMPAHFQTHPKAPTVPHRPIPQRKSQWLKKRGYHSAMVATPSRHNPTK